MLNFNPVSKVYIGKYALATGTVEKLVLYISEFTKIMSTTETVQNTYSKQKCIENFTLGQLAKRLFKRRVILVQLKEYTMLVKKLHHVFRVFSSCKNSSYLVMNGLEHPEVLSLVAKMATSE